MTGRRRASTSEPREMDARLAVAAVAGWGAVLSFTAGPEPSAVAVFRIALGCGLAGVVAVIARFRSRRPRSGSAGVLAVVAVALLGAAVALAALGAELHRVRDGPLPELAARRAVAVVEATVSDDPRLLGGGVVVAGPRVAVSVLVTGVRSGRVSYRVRAPAVVLAPAAGWLELVPGQRIRLDGRLAPAQSGELVAAAITARGQPERVGRPPWWQRVAAGVRADLRIASSGLPPAERGLLPGLVDGDTSGLDPVLAERFRVAGLTHLVAVSGTNAMIVVGSVLLVLKRFGVRRGVCAAVGMVTLLAFVVVARPSPSVVRAGVMAAVVLAALALGRPRQGLPALSFATLVLLVWRPAWAHDAGFAMSVLATAALLILGPGWADALRRRAVPPVLAEAVAVAAAATVVTAPVLVLISGQVSLVSLPANVLAEFAVAPATVLGVLAAVTAPISAPVGAVFATAAGWPCRWLVGTAEFFGTRPAATLAWPRTAFGALLLAALTVVAVLAARVPRVRGALLAGALVLVAVQIPIRSFTANWPVDDAALVACDVGQGDGLVLPVGGGSAVVVDSGPEPVAIDRCLRSLGVHRVVVYVQSHFDLDHVGGLPGLVRDREIGLVLTGPLLAPALGRAIMTRALDPLGIRSQVAPAGAVIEVGPVRLQVLASRAVEVDGAPESNNSSLIVRATAGGRRILLLGDAEVEAQQLLLDSGADVRADVLKVAHHGSANFDPDLYAAVHARLAVISVGADNPYGHPTGRVLADLSGLGVPVVRTDQDGDIAIVPVGPDGLRTVSHRPASAGSAWRPVPDRGADPGGGGGPGPPSASAVGSVVSGWRVTMDPCQPRASTTPVSFSSSVTRSSSSTRPSSRSPPPAAGPIPRTTPWCSRGPAWPRPSCTKC